MLTRRMPHSDEDALFEYMKFEFSTSVSSEIQALVFTFFSLLTFLNWNDIPAHVENQSMHRAVVG